MTSVRIAASLMAANGARLEDELRAVERVGVDLFHWDIMDGHFVPNLTFGPQTVKDLRGVTALPFDIHLMVTNPENWIDPFVDAGADSITIHLEAQHDVYATLKKIKDKKLQAGLAINPETSIENLDPIYFSVIDRIVIMSVKPGFGGQKYMNMGDKIRQCVKWKHTYPNLDIMVDGGINMQTAPDAIAAGATTLVSGSALFAQTRGYNETIATLKGGKE